MPSRVPKLATYASRRKRDARRRGRARGRWARGGIAQRAVARASRTRGSPPSLVAPRFQRRKPAFSKRADEAALPSPGPAMHAVHAGVGEHDLLHEAPDHARAQAASQAPRIVAMKRSMPVRLGRAIEPAPRNRRSGDADRPGCSPQSVPSTTTTKARTGLSGLGARPVFRDHLRERGRRLRVPLRARGGARARGTAIAGPPAPSARKAIRHAASARLRGRLAFDQLEQLLEIGRLGEVVVEAGLARAPPVVLLAPAGDRDEQHVVAALLRAVRARCRSRRAAACRCRAGPPRAGTRRRPRAPRGRRRRCAPGSRITSSSMAEAVRGVRVVVDHEDARGAAAGTAVMGCDFTPSTLRGIRNFGSADLGEQLSIDSSAWRT